MTKPLTMMSGKFHRLWGDFGSLKNVEAMEYEAFRALAYGCRVCIGDQLLPDGHLEPSVYRQIQTVFHRIALCEDWIDGAAKQAEIGVLLDNAPPAGPGMAIEGAYRMLTESHLQFDFIDFTDKLDVTRYKLLILPDKVRLPALMAQKLQQYLVDGGKVLLTHKSGLKSDQDVFSLEEFGVKYLGSTAFTPRYMHVGEGGFGDIPPMDYVFYEQGSEIEAFGDTRVLVCITHPWFNRSPQKFCSHLHTPPAYVTQQPCITTNGQVTYIAQPLFTDYVKVGNRVFRQIITTSIADLLGTPLVQTDLPITAECMLWEKDDCSLLHVVSYIVQKKCREMEIVEERFPLVHRHFQVQVPRQPKSVSTLFGGIEIPFTYNENQVAFYGDIDGYQIFKIEMKDQS